jgi:hypothetical protein
MQRFLSVRLTACSLSVLMLSACQAIPSASSVIVPSAPSALPGPSPTVSPSATEQPPQPLTTPLPNSPEGLVPDSAMPTAYPTPILQPGYSQAPNPWPTNLNLRQEGDPIPTPPPEPTPHPGDCGACRISWSEIGQTTWTGKTLIYLETQQSRVLRSSDGRKSTSQLFRLDPGQTPKALPFTPISASQARLMPLSEDHLLYLATLGSEANLARLPLNSPSSLETLSNQMVLDASLNSERTQLAWTSYEQSHQNIPFYTSPIDAFRPTLIGRLSSSSMVNISWIPGGQGWAFFDINDPQTTSQRLFKLDPQGSQSVWLNLPAAGRWPEKIRSFKFSPDGQFLAVVVDSLNVTQGNTGIFWKGVLWLGSAHGQDLRKISALERVDADFDWSPDSSKLVVAAGTGEAEKPVGQDLYTIAAKSDQTQRLTDSRQNPEWLHSQPRWSPDGQSISFVSNRAADFRLDFFIPTALYLIKSDGTGLTNITTSHYKTEPVPPQPEGSYDF